MWIRNKEDIKRFEETIKKCKESVMVVADNGESYDLKDFKGYYLGIASLMNPDKNKEPEVFANCKEDQGLLLNYLMMTEKMASAC